MFKSVEKYRCEELLSGSQGFVGSMWWLWYEAALDVVGKEQAEKIAVRCGELMGPRQIEGMKAILGKEFENVEEMSKVADVVHAMMGYVAPWILETKFKGYEKVTNCTIYNNTPEKFEGGNVLKKWCITAGEAVYPKLHPSKPKLTRSGFMCEGDPHCIIEVEMQEP